MKSKDNGSHTAGALLRLGLYALIVLTPLIIVGALRPATDHGFVYTIGKNFALAGFTILAMQFVLSARLPWIERPFGLNMVFHFHKTMALVATILIVSHPLLLASDGSNWNLIFGPDIEWHVWLGRIALIMLLMHVLFALFRRVLAMNYQTWRFMHDIGAVVLLSLAFFHSWNAGGDLALIPMRFFWSTLLLAAMSAFFWHRLLRTVLLSKSPYEVTDVKKEAEGIWTVSLAPQKAYNDSIICLDNSNSTSLLFIAPNICRWKSITGRFPQVRHCLACSLQLSRNPAISLLRLTKQSPATRR